MYNLATMLYPSVVFHFGTIRFIEKETIIFLIKSAAGFQLVFPEIKEF